MKVTTTVTRVTTTARGDFLDMTLSDDRIEVQYPEETFQRDPRVYRKNFAAFAKELREYADWVESL